MVFGIPSGRKWSAPVWQCHGTVPACPFPSDKRMNVTSAAVGLLAFGIHTPTCIGGSAVHWQPLRQATVSTLSTGFSTRSPRLICSKSGFYRRPIFAWNENTIGYSKMLRMPRVDACFCSKVTLNQLSGFDHSVFDTFVQLTEGRSARDQPKQPPAKKRMPRVRNHSRPDIEFNNFENFVTIDNVWWDSVYLRVELCRCHIAVRNEASVKGRFTSLIEICWQRRVHIMAAKGK